jgi:hypothetical protein
MNRAMGDNCAVRGCHLLEGPPRELVFSELQVEGHYIRKRLQRHNNRT